MAMVILAMVISCLVIFTDPARSQSCGGGYANIFAADASYPMIRDTLISNSYLGRGCGLLLGISAQPSPEYAIWINNVMKFGEGTIDDPSGISCPNESMPLTSIYPLSNGKYSVHIYCIGER